MKIYPTHVYTATSDTTKSIYKKLYEMEKEMQDKFI